MERDRARAGATIVCESCQLVLLNPVRVYDKLPAAVVTFMYAAASTKKCHLLTSDVAAETVQHGRPGGRGGTCCLGG